jgi:hypothetical protein
VQHAILS